MTLVDTSRRAAYPSAGPTTTTAPPKRSVPPAPAAFLPARRCATAGTSQAMALGPSVCNCLSQVGVPSKRLNESSWVLVWELGVFPKNKGTSIGKFAQTPDLENFASADRSSKRVIDLAQSVTQMDTVVKSKMSTFLRTSHAAWSVCVCV